MKNVALWTGFNRILLISRQWLIFWTTLYVCILLHIYVSVNRLNVCILCMLYLIIISYTHTLSLSVKTVQLLAVSENFKYTGWPRWKEVIK